MMARGKYEKEKEEAVEDQEGDTERGKEEQEGNKREPGSRWTSGPPQHVANEVAALQEHMVQPHQGACRAEALDEHRGHVKKNISEVRGGRAASGRSDPPHGQEPARRVGAYAVREERRAERGLDR